MDSPTPPLMSRSSLARMKAVLDVGEETVFVGVSHRTLSLLVLDGHLCLIALALVRYNPE